MSSEILPCPGCGSDYITIYADRMKDCFIRCDCGFEFRIYSRGCHDPTTGDLIDGLIEGWNARSGEVDKDV